MSCPNATAPINLIRNRAGVCRLKCNYEQHYKPTSVSAENKGEYIRYTFSQSDVPPVTFNSEQYNVGEMRLYRPSLHRYGGVQCAGELLIDHTNVSQNTGLLVCIPIVVGSDSTGIMDGLISQVASRANSNGGTTTIGSPSFSIAKLIPNKPFYSYSGTMPVIPCIGTKNYVVFDRSAAIKITSKNLSDLKQIITEHSYSIQTNPEGFYYNKDGQSRGAAEDEIYIECSPTGDDGNVIIDKSESSQNDNRTLENITDFFKQPWIKYSIISIGVACLMRVVWYFFGSYISSTLLSIKSYILSTLLSIKTFVSGMPKWVILFILSILSPFVFFIMLYVMYVMYLFIVKITSM